MSLSRGDTWENVELNRSLFLNELNITESELAQGIQISGDGIKLVEAPGKYSDCDAMITSSDNVYLSILTADCIPVLMWSEDKPVVAAVHSGWRGSELDLLGHTIQILKDSFDISSTAINVVVGPGLSQENFEVGPEFKDKFPPKYLQELKHTNQIHFDNNTYLKDAAIKQGVPESKIEILDYCSYRDENLFFSHRRDKGETGRMLSVIGIKK